MKAFRDLAIALGAMVVIGATSLVGPLGSAAFSQTSGSICSTPGQITGLTIAPVLGSTEMSASLSSSNVAGIQALATDLCALPDQPPHTIPVGTVCPAVAVVGGTNLTFLSGGDTFAAIGLRPVTCPFGLVATGTGLGANRAVQSVIYTDLEALVGANRVGTLGVNFPEVHAGLFTLGRFLVTASGFPANAKVEWSVCPSRSSVLVGRCGRPSAAFTRTVTTDSRGVVNLLFYAPSKVASAKGGTRHSCFTGRCVIVVARGRNFYAGQALVP